jgi:hypothetical protein
MCMLKQRRPTRRQVLIGLPAAAAGGALLVYITADAGLEYDFFQRYNDGTYEVLKKLTGDAIEATFVPLGPAETLHPESELYRTHIPQARKALRQNIIDNGHVRNGKISVKSSTATRRRYGYPEPTRRFGQQFAKYCEHTTDFLYNHPHMELLKKPPLAWSLLEGPLPESDELQGVVGHSYADVITYTVTLADFPKRYVWKAPLMATGGFNEAAFKYQKGELVDVTHADFLFVSTSAYPGTCLVSPFSEIIPLTTSKRTHERILEHTGDPMSDVGLVCDETLSEGLSHMLAHQLCDELDIPSGHDYVNGAAERMKSVPVYKYVPLSVAWIQNNGMDAALELYLEDPVLYMNAIGAEL